MTKEIKDGETIVYKGQKWVIKDGKLEPSVWKGCLGGELQRLDEVHGNKTVLLIGSRNDLAKFLPPHTLVEVDFAQLPNFTSMKAKDAADVPGIVGKYIAMKVFDSDSDKSPLCCGADPYGPCTWVDKDSEVFLIDGIESMCGDLFKGDGQ